MADPVSTTVKLPLPEQIIAGRYKLLRSLGQGGMGLVFLAEQLGVGNQVAVKFLDPEPTQDDTRIARFLREAKVGLEVKHPGAAQVLDLGRDESLRLYLVFEYVEGEDLRAVLSREGRLRFDEAKEIALKVAEVLAFAHERGVVHRDIKPENVRVRRDLAGVHVKVLDFGIARLVKDTGVRLTAEGSLAGTPRYMAPEQVRDGPIDARTDGYALGLVLFEMLSGAAAFGGKNISQILLKQVQDPLPPLKLVDPQLDFPAVDAVLARACAKLPADRYASMADFVAALKALHVDTRAWPAPRFPPATTADSQTPTRDGKRAGESDTVIRDLNPTEPSHPSPLAGVGLGSTSSSAPSSGAGGASSGGPSQLAVPASPVGAASAGSASSGPAASGPASSGSASSGSASSGPASGSSSPAAGAPTRQPDRSRETQPARADVRNLPTRLTEAHVPGASTVYGAPVPKAPARRRWPVVLALALALAATAGVWWLRFGAS
ncbi:MAG: serine/threonine-protein kinase [Myxococcota bacterium]